MDHTVTVVCGVLNVPVFRSPRDAVKCASNGDAGAAPAPPRERVRAAAMLPRAAAMDAAASSSPPPLPPGRRL